MRQAVVPDRNQFYARHITCFVTRRYRLDAVPCRGREDKIIQIKDPVHSFIDISEYPLVRQLVDTPYFQRLRRLHQLGLAPAVYPSATHTRFAHSLGVMHAFLILFDSVVQSSTMSADRISRIRPVGAAAALLHDIGHGPFSHASEKFLDGGRFNHETLTCQIIQNTEISDILKDNRISARLVCDILNRNVSGEMLFVSQLISSQLDADRIDYLMRDALFTGVPYGSIDISRIASMLKIWNHRTLHKSLRGTVVVSQKGIESVEDYLLGRYLMYKGVYYHKTIRCLDNILVGIFQRAMELQDPLYVDLFPKKITPQAMLQLDDHVCHYIIHQWTKSDDPILGDLCRRLVDRRLFKAYPITDRALIPWMKDNLATIQAALKRKKLDYNYYFIADGERRSGYEPYAAESGRTPASHHILVITSDGGLREISQVSPLVESISKNDGQLARIFFPEQITDTIDGIMRSLNRNHARPHGGPKS